MMKVLFFTADLGGNVPPTLAIAEVLARRGVELEVAGLKPGRTALPQLPFAAATAISPDGRSQGLRDAGAGLRLMLSRKTSADVCAHIVDRHADLVVVDCMIPALIRGALDSGIAVVVLFHTFGGFWMHDFDNSTMARAFGLFGLTPRRLWDQAAERLLVTDEELDPGRGDAALANYIWTGTTEVGTAGNSAPNGRSKVLVSLSTTGLPGMVKLYQRIISALDGLPVDAVVTAGSEDLASKLRGTSNVDVRGWADHADLLPNIDLMIGHGGHSSTLKALAHGVPLVVLPVNPSADQQLIGRVIQDNGLGRCLPKSARPSAIRETVHAMLTDTEVRDRARTTGARLRARPPGAEVAADRIVEILNARAQTPQ